MVAGALDRPAEEGASHGLTRWVRQAADAQQGRTFVWAPVGLTVGVWTYFGLPHEPSTLAVLALALAGLAVLWFARNMAPLVLVALVVLGFSLAKLRSDLVATPLLRATTAEVLVTGTVTDIQTAGGGRLTLLLAPDAIEGLTADRTPRTLRLSASAKLGRPGPGQRIAVKAYLAPLPTPVEPGGFDYGRKLWFESVGGTGRITAPIEVLDADVPRRYLLQSLIGGIRRTMGERIHANLDGTMASFAEALITGERSTIPKAVNQSLLVSGLFHILSISGLHMWLVAGGVFWTVRAGLALIPPLVLRYPVKKWAAASAILMGLFYMLLAEGGVATQRSFIMIAVVFFAVIADRPALSTRNLAIAAMAVLLLEPEAAIEASFQMSFLAVLGIVAFAEFWMKFNVKDEESRLIRQGRLRRFAGKAAAGFFVALATSVIASSMSSIPAAYHFGRLAPYGLVANGLALPVIGFIVMPMALLAAVLMPLGLEALPLQVMGEGLRLVMVISDSVAALPGAYVIVPQPPALAVMALAFGACAFCLLAGPIRFAGAGAAVLGLGLTLTPLAPPDVLVERSGGNVAIRNAVGELVPALPRKARFTVEKWLQTSGEEATAAEAAKRSGWTCAASRCDTVIKGKRLAYVFGDTASAVDCGGLDILIADFPLRGTCRMVPTRIDRFDLWRGGAQALRVGASGVTIATARGEQGQRPWMVVPEARKDKFIRRDRVPSTHLPPAPEKATASP